MNLVSIKISNMLSFEYHENIDECEEIKFKDGINTLIAPNGSGKSNFLEIVNKFINYGLIQQASYSEASIQSYKIKGGPPDFTNTIQLEDLEVRIAKNRYATSDAQKIKATIGLSNSDKDNLRFIHQHASEINSLCEKYCKKFPTFPNISEQELMQIDSITVEFESSNPPRKLSITSRHNGAELFVLFYIQFFSLLQNLIHIANREEAKGWTLFKNTFALLNSQRNYNQIESIFKVGGDESSEINSAKLALSRANLLESEQQEPYIFMYVRKRLGFAFHHMLEEIGSKQFTESGTDPIDAFDDELFVKINTLLKKTLGMRLHIKKTSPNSLDYVFSYRYFDTGQQVSVQELSSGERGLIHFIFSIFGNDLENGQMILDEPEIHLHPQLQETCLEIMLESAKLQTMQFIIATHSPVFVNSKTIMGVQRFYKKDEKFTKTILPQLTNDNHDLVRYLDFTRATKILFNTKVVLVEGDSDEYCYKFLFEKFRESKSNLKKIEFIHIIGKNYYSKWKLFFDSWKIKCYFIRDNDNFGGSVVDIETKYTSGIFILKQGDLETYIGNEKNNKLENAIDFCQNRYNDWLDDSEYEDKREEIKTIMEKIMS